MHIIYWRWYIRSCAPYRKHAWLVWSVRVCVLCIYGKVCITVTFLPENVIVYYSNMLLTVVQHSIYMYVASTKSCCSGDLVHLLFIRPRCESWQSVQISIQQMSAMPRDSFFTYTIASCNSDSLALVIVDQRATAFDDYSQLFIALTYWDALEKVAINNDFTRESRRGRRRSRLILSSVSWTLVVSRHSGYAA